jgi:3-isopropylmalate/(R)-2-methylmalate dehydratase small subunit
MNLSGRIHCVGDHIDTDQIIPSRFLGSADPASLRSGCFLNLIPGFPDRVAPGDVLVAGENFGCGSSREHAPIAIKATGIACVVAKSFSRIFYRSAINIGLPAISCPEAVDLSVDGQLLSVDFDTGLVSVGRKSVPFTPFSPEILEIISAGGLVPFMAKRLSQQGAIA